MIIFYGLLIASAVVFGYYVVKFANPYKLIMVFGKKGAGKTTYLCKLAQLHLRKGWTVYSTEHIPGAYKIEPSDVGFVQFPKKSVLLLDEVGMYYDNRDYKSFKKEVGDYFRLQRHYGHRVYLFSQSFDTDVKIRRLVDKMYLMVNYFGFISVGKEIRRRIVVVKPSEDSESRIADELVITPFLLTPFGARVFIFVPKWIKYFDSYVAPELAHKEFQIVDYPAGTPERFKPKQFRSGKQAA